MSRSIAIIGDVHGNASALAGLLRAVEGRCSKLVFVGDYVNRGPNSAEVIQLLVDESHAGAEHVYIAGNHDVAFLDCLDHGRLFAFLRIGGAATIRSYISNPEPDVLEQLRRTVPEHHINFLRTLKDSYEEGELLVTHRPNPTSSAPKAGVSRFHVFGHVPQPDLVPQITRTSAAIDTGCGTLPNGRLTCLIWPNLESIQVDSAGTIVTRSGV
jgi:serine/threonine protein phosphatase 1